MKVEISVPELVNSFKEIQGQPEPLFEIIRVDTRESAGQYLTKMMEARKNPLLPGENACYMLLTLVSIKMELHWRSNPIGKVRKNLPFFKE